MDPLIRGDYPLSMRRLVGNRLPQFTKEQSELVKGAFDFIGLNYYTGYYTKDVPPSNGPNKSYNTDAHANITGESTKTSFAIPFNLILPIKVRLKTRRLFLLISNRHTILSTALPLFL